jgi:hypothetical protein
LVERVPPRLGARHTLGPDHILAVRAGDHPDLTAVLDIVERGVVDAPSPSVEPVEHVGDVVALVVLHGDPCPTETSRSRIPATSRTKG